MEGNRVGIARVFQFLANVERFPVPIVTAACISGLPEADIRSKLGQALSYAGYEIQKEGIKLKEDDEMNTNQVEFNKLAENANDYPVTVICSMFNRNGTCFECNDGRISKAYVEVGNNDSNITPLGRN